MQSVDADGTATYDHTTAQPTMVDTGRFVQITAGFTCGVCRTIH